jgi:predicted tellurium resistance membrane protein TerC
MNLSPLFRTIIAVELADMMFSVDSIGAALAVSNDKWVLIAGALIGILLMRIASGAFIELIARYPKLETLAFILVGIAGIKLLYLAIQFTV